jgi:hypothetical protein
LNRESITKKFKNIAFVNCASDSTKPTISSSDCNLDALGANAPSSVDYCGSNSTSSCCYVVTNDSTPLKVCKSVTGSNKTTKADKEAFITSYYANVSTVTCPADKVISNKIPLLASNCGNLKITSSGSCGNESKCCSIQSFDTTPTWFCSKVTTNSKKGSDKIKEISDKYSNTIGIGCLNEESEQSVLPFPDSTSCGTKYFNLRENITPQVCNDYSNINNRCCYVESSDGAKKICIQENPNNSTATTNIKNAYGVNIKSSSIQCSSGNMALSIIGLIASVLFLI